MLAAAMLGLVTYEIIPSDVIWIAASCAFVNLFSSKFARNLILINYSYFKRRNLYYLHMPK